MEKPLTAIVLGAGSRGRDAYGAYSAANRNKIQIIGVAEPVEERRQHFNEIHDVPEENSFDTWEKILAKPKFADAAIITTQDDIHTQPAIQAMELGYDVLLEKPMSNKLDECVQLVKKSEELGKHLQICHVLRYAKFYSTVYDVIHSGKIGDLINIECKENVTYWHFAHSFVRGYWRNSIETSPLILAKCCHDLDLLYWMVGTLPKKINSFGSLTHYKADQAPPDAPKRCLDGCPHTDTCIHYAPFLYIDVVPLLRIGVESDWKLAKFFAGLALNHKTTFKVFSTLIPPLKQLSEWKQWPISVITDDLSYEGKLKALEEGPWGRCVYHCDNNQPDHIIVGINFENGVTANLTVHGHSAREGRSIRVDGTKGTLIGEFLHSGEKLWFYDKLSGKKELVHKARLFEEGLVAHGGGDWKLMDAFVDLLRNDITKPLTGARASLESHIMAFAAEKSRVEGKTISMEDYRKEVMAK
ncbi:MAG: Gfo/Idh/MocA family oxidoreductase [Candidatus Helarchaeota archaeon]|nr:Gfo/Idh/MocA family oxidoreductase [Candidatus Helarchaeota archaeon]